MLLEMTSKNSDGTYDQGAYCLLNHKQYNQNGQSLEMIERYHGRVIREYERNGYDDSDFVAVVWDDEVNHPKHVVYATTRAWSYACSCSIDATPEVMEKYTTWMKIQSEKKRVYDQQVKEFTPQVGKLARSLTVRGKAKGFVGEIIWQGDKGFGMSVKLRNEQGYMVFVPLDRIEIFVESRNEFLPPAIWSHKIGTWFVPKSIIPAPEFDI